MSELIVKHVKIGPLFMNCYCLSIDNKCILIDPGSDDARAKERMNELIEGKELLGIICTHNHFDHITGLHLFDNLKFMHEIDIALVPKMNARTLEKWNLVVPKTGDLTPLTLPSFTLGPFTFKVFHTPGHTNGGVCLQIENHLFTGDTLFAGTYGRTDAGGNAGEMHQSLKFLSTLSPELIIHPGHGPKSTIEAELPWIHELLERENIS